MLTQETLQKWFSYRNGRFYYKKVKGDRNSHRKWKQEAGCFQGDTGYRILRVEGKIYYEHRLVWLWFNKEMPGRLKHKDGIKHHNWYGNLELILPKIAILRDEKVKRDGKVYKVKKKKLSKRNSTGVNGILFNGINIKSGVQSWKAVIGLDGKQRYLGSYKTKEDAAYARYTAEQCIGYGGKSSAKEFIESLGAVLQG